MTAVEYLVEKVFGKETEFSKTLIDKALKLEQKQIMDTIIEFQLFMYENDFISNHLWDYEDMAIKFLNSKNDKP